MASNFGIKILGTGSFKPDFVVTNNDYSALIETDDEWITTRTGIKQRRFALNSTNFDMSVQAARRALSSANMNGDEIDMVIASTTTPDYFYPSLSCLIQRAVGASNAFAIDVNAACTGFVNAFDIARNYLATQSAKKILIVSGEMLSNHVDFTDRATCVLFGDGAGAMVVEGDCGKRYAAHLGAVGEVFDKPSLYCKVPYRPNNPFCERAAGDSPPAHGAACSEFLAMEGRAVYKFATEVMSKAVKAVCAKSGTELSEIDLLLPHQANIRIIKTAMKNLDIPMDKVYVNIHDTGNISSACIPVCLDELYAAGRIQPGMKICMVAFGAGLTYGSIIMEV